MEETGPHTQTIQEWVRSPAPHGKLERENQRHLGAEARADAGVQSRYTSQELHTYTYT